MPGSLGRGACAIVRAGPDLSAAPPAMAASVGEARLTRAVEPSRNQVERDPTPSIFSQASAIWIAASAQHNDCGTFRGVEYLSALPVGVPPLRRPEISHGGWWCGKMPGSDYAEVRAVGTL